MRPSCDAVTPDAHAVDMNQGITVVVCCHNSSARIVETLRHLMLQRSCGEMPWEVLLIDNASTDGTHEVALGCWPSHHPVPLRIVREPRVGLVYARERAISEARYDTVSFIDDDNRVCESWVKRVYDFFKSHRDVALLGGPSQPESEKDPPAWFHAIRSFYAVGSQHSADGDVTDTSGTLLWGAGISVRKTAFEQLLREGFAFECSGRMGGKLTAGEDSELCFALRASGWRIYYDGGLELRHFIPRERLDWSYARRLFHGMGSASPVLNAYRIALSRRQSTSWERRLKESWAAQFFKSLRQLIQVFCSSPLHCIKGSEGCMDVLRMDRAIGEFLTYLRLFGGYRGLICRLRHAAWNRPTVRPKGLQRS